MRSFITIAALTAAYLIFCFLTAEAQNVETLGPFGLSGGGSLAITQGASPYGTFEGVGAGAANTTGTNNTAFGYNALNANTTATSSTAVGYSALAKSTGQQNTAIGNQALANNTTATALTAVGNNALNAASDVAANLQATTAVGAFALSALTTGLHNNAFGTNAMKSQTCGNYNVALGKDSLFSSNQGCWNGNTAVGEGAMVNWNGSSAGGNANNTALGQAALSGAASQTNSGIDNTGIGMDTGFGLTTGAKNTLLGRRAGFGITSGSQNLLLGWEVSGGGGGQVLATGSRNILIGTAGSCDVASDPTNDQFLLCASTGTTQLMVGNLAAGSLALTINGPLSLPNMAAASAAADIVCFVTSSGLTTYASSVANCAASSIDLKNPIGEIDPDVAIKKVMALRPAIYTYKDPQEYGPLPYVGLYAQDVCKMDERLCFYDGNLREPTNGAAIHNYDKVGVTAYLVAAIQAQQREIDQLRRERHRRHRNG